MDPMDAFLKIQIQLEEQEVAELMEREIPEEFDTDFLINNPNVVQNRMNFLDEEDAPNVNLPNNNSIKLKKFGLNENKRGKIKQHDQSNLSFILKDEKNMEEELEKN